MRKFIVAIALLLGIIFVIARQAEVQAILETLQRGDWRFLLLALLIDAVWMVNVAASYRSIYRALGLDEALSRLFILALTANFINVVAPSAGMGGMAVFISEGRRRGHSSARVTTAGVLFVLFEYFGVLTMVALGLIVLFRRNNLTSSEIVASAILAVLAAVLTFLIYLGMQSAAALGNALAWMARRVNWAIYPFIHRDYLSEERAHSFAHDAAEGLSELRTKPKKLTVPLLLALSSKAILVVILSVIFLAFKVPFTAGTVIAGFSIGYLFMIVSPTPAGIGVVEGALTLALRSLNVPLGAAAVIALAYRGITFWIPMLLGLVAFRWLSRDEGVNSSV